MAFSMAPIRLTSQGCTVINCGSGALTLANWFSGIWEPYASTVTPSSMCTDARPVRVEAISLRKSSTAFSMRVLSCAKLSFRAGIAAIDT